MKASLNNGFIWFNGERMVSKITLTASYDKGVDVWMWIADTWDTAQLAELF